MQYNVDDMTAVERPRKRLLLSIAAVIVPVIVLAGASVWFIRAYVLPPSITIEPLAVSSADTTPVASSETTGNAPAPAPTVRYSNNSAEVWASVPLPGPAREVQRSAPEPEATPSEPLNGPVPLPPRRPRLSDPDAGNAVPLPRSRPVASN